MKIIILHGDDRKKVADRITKFTDVARSRGWKIEKIDPLINSLKNIILGQELFSTERFFIVEEIKKISTEDKKWLKNNSDSISGNLIFVNYGLLTKLAINWIPKPNKIEEYKVSKKIWAFIDSFYPSNSLKCLEILHEVVKTEPTELVVALLARRLKDIFMVKKGILNLTGWQLNKIKNQGEKYAENVLVSITNDLAHADFKAKTGGGQMETFLDLIIVSQLE
jgi:hypothetical protein